MKIKPLKWERRKIAGRQHYHAKFVAGNIGVWQSSDGKWIMLASGMKHSRKFKTCRAAKAAANEHHAKMLRKWVTE